MVTVPSPQVRDLYLNSQEYRQVYLSVDEPFSGSILTEILGVTLGKNSGELPVDSVEDWLTGIARAALNVALDGVGYETQGTQLSLVITDDETVHELNAQFRGLDEVTDVLSFSADHPGPVSYTHLPLPTKRIV